MLEDTDLLEGLHDLTVDGAGGIDVVGGAGAAVLGGTVDLAETANTDGLAHVDVASDGGGADVVPICKYSLITLALFFFEMFELMAVVVPVGILGRELVGGGGLDSVNPSYLTVLVF